MRLIVLLFLVVVHAYGQELQRGTVLKAVQYDVTDNTSYALYLPRNYDEDTLSPVVFVFNENEQGAAAVQRFVIGANLTESVVVSPNFVFNDSLSVALKSSEKLINHILDRYQVDDKKLILAGIEKGALLASTSAHLSQDVRGVIAIEDAFVDLSLLKKNPGAKFVLLTSDEGSHYYKMRGYQNQYDLREKLAGFYEYDSKNGAWPAAGFLAAALVDVLMDGNTSDEKVQLYYENDLAYGDLLFRKRRHLEAYNFVSGLKKQYKKRVDLTSQRELIKEIRGNATYKVMRLHRNAATFDEQLLAQDFTYFLDQDARNAFFDNLGWWSYQMDNLDAKIDSTATNVQEGKAAIRLKKYVDVSVEDRYELIKKTTPSIEQLLFINVLRTLVNPDNVSAFIQAISLSAKDGDENASLFYLEELLKMGYTNYEQLYTIEGTTALRIGKEWNEIVKAYLGKSKFYRD